MPAYTGLRGKVSPLSIVLIISMIASGFFAAQSQAASPDAASLWSDFCHYTLIARPDLAKDSAQVLLKKVDESKLLDTVEASDYADNYENILVRAQKYKDLRDVAVKLEKQIQSAQIARATDKKRIAKNIALLDQGRRAYTNAVARLKGAGQFAAPQLLETLKDSSKQDLHPYIINAMEAIGHPMVLPLSTALPHLNSSTMVQVAQVLAEINYPEALPALSKVSHDKDIDSKTRKVLKQAYNQLLANAGKKLSGMNTAQLYVRAGQAAYAMQTVKQKKNDDNNSKSKRVVWGYNKDLGLIKIEVPASIFGDVLAMRYAKSALKISPDMSPALSLWLMANLRRQNHLGSGQKDPTYGHNMKPAKFYAMLSGPKRLKDVLVEALADHDSNLALDAINALSKTAGANALLSNENNRRPLIVALSYPDKRVRFRAASALASARPQEKFVGYKLVVPALASAIRSEGSKYAVVLANSQQRSNDLASWLNKLGYETITGKTLGEVTSDINQRPGIDLIVTDQSTERVNQIYKNTSRSYKLRAVPVLALSSSGKQNSETYKNGYNSRIFFASVSDQKSFAKALKSVMNDYYVKSLSKDKQADFALKALSILRKIAFSHAVYDITDAQPTIISAASDKRENISKKAAGVLTLIDNKKAQQALAKRALNTKGDMQIFMLSKLADSATHWGNKLSSKQVDSIDKLVENSKDKKLAVAAAQVHGALSLPTSSAVKMLMKNSD